MEMVMKKRRQFQYFIINPSSYSFYFKNPLHHRIHDRNDLQGDWSWMIDNHTRLD